MSPHKNKISDPTLTLQTDTIKTKANNVVFNAPLVSQVATLQTGDFIIDTGTGGTLDAVFNPVAVNLLGAAIEGVATWNLTNVGTWGAPQWIAGGPLITGLKTLNDLNSNAPIVVGVTGAPLETALTTVGLTDTNSGQNSSLTVLIAAAALSGSHDALKVNVNSSSNAFLTIGPDGNATNGYEVWNINATGNDILSLSQGGATSGNTIKVSGPGNIELFDTGDAMGFLNLTTIDASASTGNVTVTSSIITGGLLTVVKGGSGNDTFDLSNAAYTPAVINAMTTLDGGTGTTETLILNNTVLTTTTALTTPTHFPIFGDIDPSGTINMALLPTSIKEIEFFGFPTGALTINSAPAVFTLDQSYYSESWNGNPLAISAADTTALTNVATIVFGVNGGGDLGGSLITTGYGTVNLSVVSSTSEIYSLVAALMPIWADRRWSTSAAILTSLSLPTLGVGHLVRIRLFSPVPVQPSTTQTRLRFLSVAPTLRSLMPLLQAALSLGADTNYSGTTGDTITGSTTAANSLGGSLGNDVITSSNIGGDTIFTNGGADTVNLNVHSVSDTIQLTIDTFGSRTSTVADNNDLVQAGFWSVPPSGPGGGVVPAASTSADQSVVTNFNPALDVLQFAPYAWGSNAFADSAGAFSSPASSFDHGLTYGDGNSTVLDLLVIHSGFVPPATVIDMTTAGATLSATANVMEVTGATFANAAALAGALSSTYQLTFAGTGVAANTDAHMLLIYNDPSGNAHIADVDFENGANGSAATTTAAVTKIVASDMVDLVGVSAASLTAHNIHFL